MSAMTRRARSPLWGCPLHPQLRDRPPVVGVCKPSRNAGLPIASRAEDSPSVQVQGNHAGTLLHRVAAPSGERPMRRHGEHANG